ncbi:MAG: hypothetical protein FWF88_08305 [Peptococcaceae bacterium]|nr:hypothetical protein [Peptococcaceae bacterium]
MNKIIMEKKTIEKRILVVAMILGIIAVAAWGLRLSIALAAKNEENKVVSYEEQGEQQDPPVILEEVMGKVDSVEAERLLDSIRIFNTTGINNVPSPGEMNEKQAAILAISEIQRVFGAELENTILDIQYNNRAMWVFSGAEEVPESIRENFMEDFREWIDPPTWNARVHIVNKNKYKECQTLDDVINNMDKEFKASGLNYQVWPTDYSCEFNALTGEVSYIFRSAPSEIKEPYGQPVFRPEQEGEPLYRGFLQQICPDLEIASLELVEYGAYYEEDGNKISSQQTKITMSDGSGFLFESVSLCLVKYFPKGVPDDAIGH